jgi:Protein of unknown function (DUF1566)
MKHPLSYALGLVSLGMIALASGSAGAVNANGPYYATPSWDQQLPASTRFIVLSNWNNEAVLDRETGLVWEKSPDTNTHSWGTATTHCNFLNLGHRKGWRVPTIQELASLVDGDPANTDSPRLAPGHPFTHVQPSSAYWSATTISSTNLSAWYVGFGIGDLGAADKSQPLFAWCVRGGQGVDPQ